MNISIETSGWEPTGSGAWTQTVTLPLNARVHIPYEDGRIVDGTRISEDTKPWGGGLRVSCVVAKVDGSAIQISLRTNGKATMSGRSGRNGDAARSAGESRTGRRLA